MTIVCGVTDSPEGRLAARVAGAIADRLGVDVVLTHAVDGIPGHALESRASQARFLQAERFLSTLALDGDAGPATTSCVVFGEPADVLSRVAEEHDAVLIVLGARAGGFRGRRLRCRLADKVAGTTSTPVVVAPPQAVQPSLRRLAPAHPPMAG
jgi:nucleotide-binding universal stress UspA family protein